MGQVCCYFCLCLILNDKNDKNPLKTNKLLITFKLINKKISKNIQKNPKRVTFLRLLSIFLDPNLLDFKDKMKGVPPQFFNFLKTVCVNVCPFVCLFSFYFRCLSVQKIKQVL